MMKNLMVNNQLASNDVLIKSVDLVDLVNEFRTMEGNRATLLHKSLMIKIKKESEILEEYGLIGRQNILPSDYINTQGKLFPCYKLSREFALQILSSESILVRAKVMEYIKTLEERVANLEEDNDELYNIAISEEELEVRKYEANVIKYGWRNISNILMNSSYKTLEDDVEDIINFHSNILKKKDRANYKNHLTYNKTEYKQIVRDRICKILEEKRIKDSRDIMTVVVIGDILNKTLNEKIKTTNRSNGRIIAHLENNVDMKTPFKDFTKVKAHGMSVNFMYSVNKYGRKCSTPTYHKWMKDFPLNSIPPKSHYESMGVDFNKPIRLQIQFIIKNNYDVDNCIKSFMDRLFNTNSGKFMVDDSIVKDISSKIIGNCNNYDEGRIYFHIENI